MAHGCGIKNFANGNIYKGRFSQDMMEGEGELKCENGNVYIGEFSKNLFDGKGLNLFSDGNVYEGKKLLKKYDFLINRFLQKWIKTWFWSILF